MGPAPAARHPQRFADRLAVEGAAIELLRQHAGVPVTHVAQRADDAERAAEEKAVRHAGEGGLPAPARLLSRAARTGTAVEEDERAAGDRRLDGGGGQALLVRQEERRAAVGTDHHVAAV